MQVYTAIFEAPYKTLYSTILLHKYDYYSHTQTL